MEINFADSWAVNALAGTGALKLVLDISRDRLESWLDAMGDFLTRKFDLDGNPKTLDYCYLYNPGNGKYDPVGLKFDFKWLKPWKTGKVWIHHFHRDGSVRMLEPRSLENWGKSKKAFIRGDWPSEVASRQRRGL